MTSVSNWTRFAKAYNNLKKHPTLLDVGEALGIADRTVRERAARYRQLLKKDRSLPPLIDRKNPVKPKFE